ncbi:MAG: phage terminase large subunit family protein, partial [Alphaproteobacteria bacterium]
MTLRNQKQNPKTPKPPPAKTWWDADERAAWAPPEALKPSDWAERYRRLRRGHRKGPWRNANAPYLRGIMNIVTRPGCVQANLCKAGQVGGSELLRTLLAYWAHVEPDPVGLTLPNRDKGRQITKGDILPMFRHTPVLRELIGSAARDTLIESISLLNGFELDLMWSGSATSMSAKAYRRVLNDEVDKFEPWTGEEPDAISATEVRLTSYGDSRLQFNVSTPTTTAGKIHQLVEGSSFKLYFHVPCPHCDHYQVQRWGGPDTPYGIKWMDLKLARLSLAAAEAALLASKANKAGPLTYQVNNSVAHFSSLQDLETHLAWLRDWILRLEKAESRRDLATLLATERERAVWYQCEHCPGRIFNYQKAAMVRRGR